MPMVNNVTRLLDAQKINYTPFETPSEKLGALETARILDVPASLVYKTIVVRRAGPGKPVLAVISGASEVDLRLLAVALGEKKMVLVSEREAEQLTGLKAGGISPLALINRGFQVVIDQAARQHGAIHISGGERGLNIKLPPEALAELTKARFAAISRES